jgi:amino acid transporter
LAIFIYATTGFTFNHNFENITYSISIFLSIIFVFFLWKGITSNKIEYKLDNAKSYVGFLGIVLMFLFLIIGVVIYPSAYFIHKTIEKRVEQNFIIKRKSITTLSSLRCGYEITLENKMATIRTCLPSKNIYNNIIIDSHVKAKTNKSFLGLTINSFEVEIKK